MFVSLVFNHEWEGTGLTKAGFSLQGPIVSTGGMSSSRTSAKRIAVLQGTDS